MKKNEKNERKWKSNEKKIKFNKKKLKTNGKKERTKNLRSLPVAMVLVLLYTSVLLYYYSKNKARETPTSGCACAHPRVPSVGTWSTTQHIQKHPKKGGKPKLPVSHARPEGIPSMSRDIGSLPVLRLPVRADFGHFQSRDFR
jgi:hypothetical protein